MHAMLFALSWCKSENMWRGMVDDTCFATLVVSPKPDELQIGSRMMTCRAGPRMLK